MRTDEPTCVIPMRTDEHTYENKPLYNNNILYDNILRMNQIINSRDNSFDLAKDMEHISLAIFLLKSKREITEKEKENCRNSISRIASIFKTNPEIMEKADTETMYNSLLEMGKKIRS
jgi:hypothetical protein